MSTLRALFNRIREARFSRICSCGHSVSANLPFCPHCGQSLTVNYFRNMD